jgi:two-component system response regulator HydG
MPTDAPASAPSRGWTPGENQIDDSTPDIDDLMARLHFAPAEGRIWLDDQRMQLIHTSAMGVLRRELIESLGIERARGLLTRMGYNSGAHDAELARRLRPQAAVADMFAVGPQLHALEGMVKVDLVRQEMDIARGQYRGEFIWRHSSEDEVHVHTYGIGVEPVCWMQIGYASGYTSVFMGRPVLFREVECRATGSEHCRIIGKPVEEWDDAEDDVRYLRAQSFSSGLSTGGRGRRGAPNPETAAMFADDEIVGVSTGFNAVCHMLRCVADTDATVLFLGESGVGKEVFARTLHRISPRADKPFIAVNCAAIPENLVESELFGVEKGAFTGATASREGRFERANGGTLFLDEIGIMNLTAQGKLLRALQEREIERVGDTRVRHIDVRVVAATNLDLKAEVRAGRFREDLFYRLNVFPVKVPPLRERREDIPVLMNHFLRKFSARHRRDVTGFTPRAINALLSYELPGNIRELENMIERGVILSQHSGAIDVGQLFVSGERWDTATTTFGLDRDGHVAADDALQDSARKSGADCADREAGAVRDAIQRIEALLSDDGATHDFSLDQVAGSLERALLERAITKADGNLSAAARTLGITRSRLVYRLGNLGITTS